MCFPLISVAAYVACGGNVDKTGHVDRNVISKIIKVDFGLHIDIDKMMDAVDKDGSGEMEFEEFQFLLSGKAQICWAVDFFFIMMMWE